MLSFSVFDERGPASDWPLGLAYLFGADEVPAPGEVRFHAGHIVCIRAEDGATGLALQYRVDPPPALAPGTAAGTLAERVRAVLATPASGEPGLGSLTLRTCLLPAREEPYLLSLELARHRIMMFLNKLEQWSLFDLPPDHPTMVQFERAREAFTAALVSQPHAARPGERQEDFSPEADRMARMSLSLAIDASEQLALVQAERQFAGRFSGELYRRAMVQASELITIGERPPMEGVVKSPDSTGVVLMHPPTVGCNVNPSQFSELLARALGAAVDFVSIPLRWVELEPTEGKYSFARTDRWIEWAVRQAKLPVAAGPIIDFREAAVPEWLHIWENDYETLRELVYEHIKQVVTRYRRTVTRWTVVSGLHVNDNFPMAFEQLMDLTRLCAMLVRKLHPQGKVLVEIDQPWGEYSAVNRRSMAPMLYADMVSQAGIGVDAYALRIQMGQPAPGRSTRDMAAFSDILDRYGALEKPIAVTALGAPSRPLPPDAGAPDAGHWRSPWSPERQAEWLTEAMSIALAKPFVHSVCWQDLYDSATPDMPAGGLLTEGGLLKPAAKSFAAVWQSLREKRSPLADLPAPARV